MTTNEKSKKTFVKAYHSIMRCVKPEVNGEPTTLTMNDKYLWCVMIDGYKHYKNQKKRGKKKGKIGYDPSKRQLAEELGTSRLQTVRDCLKRLEKAGIITIDVIGGTDTNMYTVKLPKEVGLRDLSEHKPRTQAEANANAKAAAKEKESYQQPVTQSQPAETEQQPDVVQQQPPCNEGTSDDELNRVYQNQHQPTPDELLQPAGGEYNDDIVDNLLEDGFELSEPEPEGGAVGDDERIVPEQPTTLGEYRELPLEEKVSFIVACMEEEWDRNEIRHDVMKRLLRFTTEWEDSVLDPDMLGYRELFIKQHGLG